MSSSENWAPLWDNDAESDEEFAARHPSRWQQLGPYRLIAGTGSQHSGFAATLMFDDLVVVESQGHASTDAALAFLGQVAKRLPADGLQPVGEADTATEPFGSFVEAAGFAKELASTIKSEVVVRYQDGKWIAQFPRRQFEARQIGNSAVADFLADQELLFASESEAEAERARQEDEAAYQARESASW